MIANIPQIGVPKIYKPALDLVSKITSEQLTSLKLAILQARPRIGLDELKAEFNPRDIGVTDSQLSNLIEFLMSLYVLQDQLEASLEEVVDALTSAITNSAEHANLEIGTGQEFKTKLLAILSLNGSLTLSAKTNELVAESENVLDTCRIFTDARPLFGEVGSEAPLGFAVMHSLKIEYERDSEKHSMYLRLTGDDLTDLAAVIERAKDKENSLVNSLRNTGIITIR